MTARYEAMREARSLQCSSLDGAYAYEQAIHLLVESHSRLRDLGLSNSRAARVDELVKRYE